MSTAVPTYSLPFMISGAVNSGVPHAICRLPDSGVVMPASPKSATRMLLSKSRSTYTPQLLLPPPRFPDCSKSQSKQSGLGYALLKQTRWLGPKDVQNGTSLPSCPCCRLMPLHYHSALGCWTPDAKRPLVGASMLCFLYHLVRYFR